MSDQSRNAANGNVSSTAFRPSQITKKDRSNLESVFLKIASRCAMNAMQQFIQYLVKHFRFLI